MDEDLTTLDVDRTSVVEAGSSVPGSGRFGRLPNIRVHDSCTHSGDDEDAT
jgi:hypothetical protein